MESPTLTAEERHRLLAVLRELDREAPEEQRANPRRKVRLNVWIRLVGERRGCREGARVPAILVNVAARGVGLQVERPLRKGCKLLLNLRFMEGGGWLVLCEVRSCQGLPTGYKVGAKFLEQIDDPDGTARPPLDWLL